MKLSNIMRFVLVGALAAGLTALAGCAANSSTGTSEEGHASDGEQAVQGSTVSTAMVAYADGDDILFVDQETGAPYVPTNLDNATITFKGQEIDEDDLAAGNLVQVTGDGIMLESYPGQYPGIVSVEVTEVGSPADAEQYADIVDTLFAAPDQSQVPTGNLDYKTDEAQVSVMLDPYEYQWQWKGESGDTQSASAEGSAADESGTLSAALGDARITAGTDAFLAFSVTPTSIEIERTPLAAGSTTKVDTAAEGQAVTYSLGQDGTAAFTIEPGYLYEIDATFPQGDADYAFYTIS